jgi:hypothetical protein
MTDQDAWPDVEGGLRDYLRDQADVAALVDRRVFFGIPDRPTFPLVTVRRVGGTDDTSDAPLDRALVQIDCWGRLFNDTNPGKAAHGDLAQTSALRLAVRKALRLITSQTPLNANVVAYGAVVQSDPFLPDPDNDRPRYAVTALVTARAA